MVSMFGVARRCKSASMGWCVIHISTYVCVCVFTHTHTHTHIYNHIHDISIYLSICIYLSNHTWPDGEHVWRGAQVQERLDGLVRRPVLAQPDRVVRGNVNDAEVLR